MDKRGFQFTIRTPHETALFLEVRSVRIPTETGQVGLREHAEPTVIAVEPGLVLAHTMESETVFAGTAGGLLLCDGMQALLLTPLAVAGIDHDTIVQQLRAAVDEPNEEMRARAMLEKLEEEILGEMRRPRKGRSASEMGTS